MLPVVKQTEADLLDWLATEAGFVEGLLRYDDEPVKLEAYQRAFMQCDSRFRWVSKARQIGYSFLFACEALARCHLRDGYTAIFVSYSQSDATEKVLLARQLFENLPLGFRKPLVTDAKTELAFESNARGKQPSRIISVPSKAPRGKKGDIYLDELAHYANDRDVYNGSTALILRAHGQLTGCSTPLGRRGVFWEVAREQLRSYPHHWRQVVPWWLCKFFCRDIHDAAIEAPSMPTAERVARFGTPAIIAQFEALGLDEFQQEFECKFVDESYSYYPYDLILPATRDEVVLVDDITDIPAPKGRLLAGYDVGRTRDLAELAIFEERERKLTCRLLKSYKQMPFAEQEAELRRVLNTLPIARLSIDATGLGMHLAENLGAEFPQVSAEPFTNASKERWATHFKILLQRKDVALPRDRALVAQIHSIRRRVLPSGKVAYVAERTGGGHADRFWAVALACQKEVVTCAPPRTRVGVRVIG